jgi:hypothetical protein
MGPLQGDARLSQVSIDVSGNDGELNGGGVLLMEDLSGRVNKNNGVAKSPTGVTGIMRFFGTLTVLEICFLP